MWEQSLKRGEDDDIAAPSSAAKPATASSAARPATVSHEDDDIAAASSAARPATASHVAKQALLQEPPPIRSVVQSAGPPDARIRLQSAKQMQEHILHPLCKAVGGNFPEWIRPQSLIVGGSDVALEHLHEAFDVDWRRVIPASGSLQVEAWAVAFYDEEPDPTPPLWPDRPRLDIVVTFTDGNWVRWHPKAKLIWSTDLMPTDAMRCRMNRKAKLLKSR